MIRPAHAGDAGAVEQLVREAYAVYAPRIGKQPGPVHDDYKALIANGSVYILDDGGIAGVAVLIPEADALLLDNVAVAPQRQGRGYGRMLIAFAEERARTFGLRAVRLYTNEAMIENVALYSQLGYVETRRGEENGFRRVYMVKRLE